MERAGFAFTAYRQAIPWDRTAERDALQVFRVFADGGAGRDVEEVLAAWPADAVVVDCLMIGALGAAIASGLPTAALVHSFYGYFRPMVEHSPAAQLAMAQGNDPVDLWERADAVLVAADRALDVAAGPVPANVHWVGVAQPPVAAPAPRADRAHVLVSFSTVWWPDQQESMQRVLDALGGLPLRVTATIGESVASAALRVPENVEVRPFVPHSELMPDVGLVVGHGGHATTMLALAHGLPVLVVPQHPELDQPIIGAVLAREGSGALVPTLPDVAEVRAAVTALLASDGPAAIGARLRATDGASRAAERIEALAGARVAA
jgi:UDP:flavonoid glycosyltransferase YjiC (YdhE family)